MAQKPLNYIGSGGYFPITLSTNEKGETGWYPLKRDINLIKQNIRSLIIYNIGQKFREEKFGTRINECLEEPNDQLLEFLVKNFLKEGITNWEPRVKSLAVATKRDGGSLYIQVKFSVNTSQEVGELVFQYNPQNQTLNVTE